MKILAVIALVVGIGAVPAFAQTQDFTFTFASSDVTATGTLVGTLIASTDIYQITSGTISITGNSNFVGTGTLDTNPSDLSAFGADNELYPAGDAFDPGDGLYDRDLDLGGLLFTTVQLNNLWGGNNQGLGSSTAYTISSVHGNDYPGTFTISQVPEGGAALMYLLLGGGACFGAMFLVSRRRLANVTAA
jgi:hypothetical protein